MKEIINNLNEENIINRNETNSISINNNEKLKKEEKDNKKNLINSKSLPKLKDKQNEKEIDIDYYSRHICTFGLETKKKLMKMKVLIVGLRGLGEEIAKNTILFGVNEVQIYDSEIVKINDLGSNFYLKNSDVGKKRRDESIIEKLSELNPRINVSIMRGNIIENIKNFNVVVITEIMEKKIIIEINEICRKNSIAFIYCAILGLSGFAFADFGNEHVIYNENGEENQNYLINKINKHGVVEINKAIMYVQCLELSDGDFVKFREVCGMTHLNDGKPRKVKIIYIEQVKLPIKKNYKSFKDIITNNYNKDKIKSIISDKYGRNELLYFSFLSIFEYYDKNKSLPNLNNKSQSNEIMEKTKQLLSNIGNKDWFREVQIWDKNIPYNIALWAKAEIAPMCSFLGGVISQEIIKYTGLYTPIDQMFVFDFFEAVSELDKNVVRILNGTRYDDQIAIFGNDIQNKLSDLNIFLVGAGTLGCEYLKNFALMGLSTNKDKKITVADDDNIRIHNLPNQFLFRKNNLGSSKSKYACIALKDNNPNVNCVSIQKKFCNENFEFFDETFLNEQSLIFSAVDNINGREYINNICIDYEKCYIDSGISGTKAHSQIIIPHLTSCYSDYQNNLKELNDYYLHTCGCLSTGKIEQCILFGFNLLENLFDNDIKSVKEFLEDKDKFFKSSEYKYKGPIDQIYLLRNILKILILFVNQNIDKIIEFSINKYSEFFDQDVQSILKRAPKNFFSQTMPHPTPFNINDELAFQFVKRFSIILSKALSIKGDLSDEYIKKVSSKVKIISERDKIIARKNSEDEKEESKLMEELNFYYKKGISPEKIHYEEFEINNMNREHFELINLIANLKARNYKISKSSIEKTMLQCGIIPTMINTASAITGISSLQIFTLLQNKNKIDNLREFNFNLGINSFINWKPSTPIKLKDKENDPIYLGPVVYIPPNHTVWDKIIISQSMTCKNFIDYFLEKYKVEISIISTTRSLTICQTFRPSYKNIENKKIEDIYSESSKIKLSKNQKHLFLEISGDIGDATAILAIVKYIFRN